MSTSTLNYVTICTTWNNFLRTSWRKLNFVRSRAKLNNSLPDVNFNVPVGVQMNVQVSCDSFVLITKIPTKITVNKINITRTTLLDDVQG